MNVLPLVAPQSAHDQASLVELVKFASALAEEINQDRFAGVVSDDEKTIALCKTLDICLDIMREEQ